MGIEKIRNALHLRRLTVSQALDLTGATVTGLSGGVTDHGALTGLGDDDHPQYVLVDGSTPATELHAVNGEDSFLFDAEPTQFNYGDSDGAGFHWTQNVAQGVGRLFVDGWFTCYGINSTDSKLGFFDVTAVVQQSHIADPAADAAACATAIASILDALEAYGLLATS